MAQPKKPGDMQQFHPKGTVIVPVTPAVMLLLKELVVPDVVPDDWPSWTLEVWAQSAGPCQAGSAGNGGGPMTMPLIRIMPAMAR